MTATRVVAALTRSKSSTEAADDEALDGAQKVEDGLGTDDEVERRGQRGPVVEVAHPQLGSCELPLTVGVVLEPAEIHRQQRRMVTGTTRNIYRPNANILCGRPSRAYLDPIPHHLLF